MQSQDDKGRVFEIHIKAKTPGFHPGANRNTSLLDETEVGKQFVKAFQQFVLAQVRSFGDALLVLKQFNQKKAGAIKRMGRVGLQTTALGRPLAQQQGNKNTGINDGLALVEASPLRRKSMFVRFPPTRLDIFGQLPSRFRGQFAPTDNALNAQPRNEITHFFRGHTLGRNADVHMVFLSFNGDHAGKIHQVRSGTQAAFAMGFKVLISPTRFRYEPLQCSRIWRLPRFTW